MNPSNLVLKVKPELLSVFYPFLGHGFFVQAPTGSSIKAYLCAHLGIDAAYFDERIQTLFLDGSPVDDPDAAQIQDGSVLALSGAMPGLAGATLRRGGFYSRLRGEISHDSDAACDAFGECRIRVKLFNLVVKDLGPMFLNKGIQVEAQALSDLLEENCQRIKKGCLEAVFDGKTLCPDHLCAMVLISEEVIFQVLTNAKP